MKLKTLKDIRKRWFNELEVPQKIIFEQEDEIKAEAIKWVKQFRKDRFYAIERKDHILHIGSDQKIGFIKKFFNITEEDLE